MGIGGGVILIPVLTLILGFEQKIAQGITLLYFIPTSIFALAVHIKNKTIDWKIAVKLISAGVFGASIGAYSIRYIPTQTLGKIFAVFLTTVGICQIVSGIKSIRRK